METIFYSYQLTSKLLQENEYRINTMITKHYKIFSKLK